jgi:hypothetical protein
MYEAPCCKTAGTSAVLCEARQPAQAGSAEEGEQLSTSLQLTLAARAVVCLSESLLRGGGRWLETASLDCRLIGHCRRSASGWPARALPAATCGSERGRPTSGDCSRSLFCSFRARLEVWSPGGRTAQVAPLAERRVPCKLLQSAARRPDRGARGVQARMPRPRRRRRPRR